MEDVDGQVLHRRVHEEEAARRLLLVNAHLLGAELHPRLRRAGADAASVGRPEVDDLRLPDGTRGAHVRAHRLGEAEEVGFDDEPRRGRAREGGVHLVAVFGAQARRTLREEAVHDAEQ